MNVIINQIVKKYDVVVNQAARQINVNIVSSLKQNQVVISQLGQRGFKGEKGDNATIPIYDENPLGLINGSNADFTSANNFVSGSLQVFIGPAKLHVNQDFQITGANGFHLFESPLTGEQLFINYYKL
jgi:hypothetical protein